MSEALLRELAKKIAHEQFLLQWPIYALMIALAIVIGIASAYLGSYAKRRGENYATKTDFDELLKQLKLTTATAEEVKATVSHADWASRELKTLRRLKLEALLQSVYELQEWQSLERDASIFNSGKDTGPSPIPKIELLSGLYFPELYVPLHDFCQIHRNMMIEVFSTSSKLLDAAGNFAEQQLIRQQFSETWSNLYQSQLGAISVVEKASRDIMQGIVDA